MNPLIRCLAVAAVAAIPLATVPAKADDCITSPTDISCGPANMNPANPLSPLNPASPFYPKPPAAPIDSFDAPAGIPPAGIDTDTASGPGLLDLLFGGLAGRGGDEPAASAAPADAAAVVPHRHRHHHRRHRPVE